MHVPEIIEIKEQLEALKTSGLLTDWELPYEHILTRRSAALFFLDPAQGKQDDVWQTLQKFENVHYQPNEEKKLSKLPYRVTFG